ncbi:MAG: hypothetical protein ACRD1Z_08910, partial [Vicinamibacteria bacterium]
AGILLFENLQVHLLVETVSGYFWIVCALAVRLALIVKQERRAEASRLASPVAGNFRLAKVAR